MAELDDRGARTEEATPRRRQEAREKGQVPLSTELLAAALLAGWTVALPLLGGRLAGTLGEVMAGGLASLPVLGTGDLGVAGFDAILSGVGRRTGAALAALLVPLLLLGVLVGYGQVGFRVAPRAVAPDLARLDPIKGLERLLGARSLVRTALALAKIATIAAVMAGAAWTQLDEIAALGGSELGPVLLGLGRVALRCSIAAVAAVVALALLDLAFQRFQHGRDLRMTRQEVKDELKSTEGDPHLRARIRRVQREMASRRMMAEVPKATVVVTNPTHYAVALRYDRDERERRSAPRVVAKGVDFLAERIKEVAREAGVVCYEDVQLARALHGQCQIGDEIPVDLYQAVATVLAYVHRVQGIAA